MEKLKRYIIFIIGLYINSFGVSLITKAALGTSPISSIPYVLSLNFPFTLGQFTIFFSILLIVLQLFILGKNFKLEHALQIPVSIAFGYFIDFSMFLLADLMPQAYVWKMIYLLLGCLILGIGVYAEVLADVVMLPGESFVRAIVFRWNTDFGITKICFDVSMAVIAVALSFVFAGKLNGVREGTIIAAILVGFIARLIGRKLFFLSDKLFPAKAIADVVSEASAAGGGLCILIGRQYGSGGRAIGKKLAEQLGFAFYDKDIIQMAAGTTGYDAEYVSENEEIMAHGLLYDLLHQVYVYPDEKAPRDNIFAAESEAIEEIAAKGNAVIVGRCADYILLGKENCISVFLFAPTASRVKRVMETEHLSEQQARQKIRQVDRRRADHYRYYTNQIWGMAANYHLCIDTSLGYDAVNDMIQKAIKAGGFASAQGQ